ncbi:hypothetical protein F4818DRAFT_329073 [Hypoxylon cercidicola]|nr:hypothetical protein F4818DRAFT_329073 [Hypoxylon cercidicola]
MLSQLRCITFQSLVWTRSRITQADIDCLSQQKQETYRIAYHSHGTHVLNIFDEHRIYHLGYIIPIPNRQLYRCPEENSRREFRVLEARQLGSKASRTESECSLSAGCQYAMHASTSEYATLRKKKRTASAHHTLPMPRPKQIANATPPQMQPSTHMQLPTSQPRTMDFKAGLAMG